MVAMNWRRTLQPVLVIHGWLTMRPALMIHRSGSMGALCTALHGRDKLRTIARQRARSTLATTHAIMLRLLLRAPKLLRPFPSMFTTVRRAKLLRPRTATLVETRRISRRSAHVPITTRTPK
jgi:hypothetical protein